MLTPYESVVKPLAIPALAGVLDVVTGVTFVIAVGGVAVGAWSLVVRFWHARGLAALGYQPNPAALVKVLQGRR